MSEAVAAPAATTNRSSPYQGLTHYESGDAAFFFGREAERKIIGANLIAARLTIAYGPSGVGKSSLLRAGVQHDLMEVAREHLAEGGPAEHLVVVFNGPWHGDPLPGLDDCIARTVEELYGNSSPATSAPPASFDERLALWAEVTDSQLLIILDQFEEYLLYADEEGGRALDHQLPLALRRADLDASFLISIRDDALAGLGRFKGRIPNLFDNYLRVDHLDRAAAESAIRGPIEMWNRSFRRGLPPIEIQDDLVDAVLDQVRTGRVVVGQTGRGTRDSDGEGADGAAERIETPHLQLVMERLWDEDVAHGTVLRLATLDTLGGAEQIVLTRGREAIDTLPEDEQRLLATIFDRLVTPSGAKIAHAIDDLAKWAGVPPQELRPILEKLTRGDLRILRPVAPPQGAPGGMRYELFHDVLGKAILDWQARYAHEQRERELAERLATEEAERERAEEQAVRERRNARRSLALAVVAGLTAIAAITLGAYALRANESARESRDEAEQSEGKARAQALALKASTELETNPHVSLVLASTAVASATNNNTDIVQPLLRRALEDDRVLGVLQLPNAHFDDAALAADGRHAFTVDDGVVRVWDVTTRAQLSTVGRAGRRVVATNLAHGVPRALTLAPNGTATIHTLLPRRREKTFRVGWSSRDATRYDHRWAAFSANGNRLALFAPSGNMVAIRNAATGALIRPLQPPRETPGHRRPNIVVLSRDGRIALTQIHGERPHVWNTNTGSEIQLQPTARSLPLTSGTQLDAAAFSPGGGFVALRYEGGYLEVWNVRTGLLRLYNSAFYASGDLAFGGLATYVGLAIGTEAWIWRLTTGETFGLAKHADTVSDLDFSPNGAYVVTGGDTTANISETTSRKRIAVLRGHRGAVTAARFSPDGTRIITASDDGTVRIWDATPRGIDLPHESRVRSAVFSGDGTRVLTGSVDKSVREWDSRTGKPRQRWNLLDREKHAVEVEYATYGRDGYRFAAVGRRVVRQWSRRGDAWAVEVDGTPRYVDLAPSGRRVVIAVGHKAEIISPSFKRVVLEERNDVSSAMFSPDGRYVLTATWPGTVSVWDARTGRGVGTWFTGSGLTRAAYSPAGKRIVTAGRDGNARIWNAKTKRLLVVLDGHTSAVTTVAFSADGKLVVTGSKDRTIRIWDSHTGDQAALLSAGNGTITSASFSRDGRSLVAASADGAVHIFPAFVFQSFETLKDRAACQALVTLTPTEQEIVNALEGEGPSAHSQRSSRGRSKPACR